MSRRSYRRLDLAFLRPDLARWPRSGLTPVQRQEDAPNQELARLHGRLAKEQVDRTGGVDEARGARGLEISHDPTDIIRDCPASSTTSWAAQPGEATGAGGT